MLLRRREAMCAEAMLYKSVSNSLLSGALQTSLLIAKEHGGIQYITSLIDGSTIV